MRIAVVYYSMTGSVYRLAEAVSEGARQAGADVRLRKVHELVPDTVLAQNPDAVKARDLQSRVPEATTDDLVWADGIALGSPTRFGNVSGQLKNFLDQTGGLWVQGKLVGKAVGFFTGANTMHGGHESTILAMSTFAYHQGLIIVPASYAIKAISTTTTGGGPYGPTELSMKGIDLSSDEREIAKAFGQRLAEVASLLAREPVLQH